MLKHCLSLKTFIPNFVAFFVSLAVVISCVRKMSLSVTSAKQEFTPAGHCFIIHLPGGGQCPLVRDSEPIRLLEIPTSPSLYMLILFVNTFVPLKKLSRKEVKSRDKQWITPALRVSINTKNSLYRKFFASRCELHHTKYK